MHSTYRVALTAALLTLPSLAALPSAQAQAQLVSNGGFETGDFTGWTTGPAGDLKVVNTTSPNNYNNYPPHSGNYLAQFASSSTADDVLKQTDSTVAGATYTVSFWLANDNQGATPQNDFKVSFGQSQLLDLENAGDFAYTQYVFTAMATNTSTVVSFSGRQPPGTFLLDDVSVTAAPEPASVSIIGMAGISLIGLLLFARKRKTSEKTAE